jgi:hypothetical protein
MQISYTIEKPGDANYLADWVEFVLFAYVDDEGFLSKAHLASFIENSVGSDPDDDLLNFVWSELSLRQRWYGDNSPFRVLDGKLIERALDWQKIPHYMAFLIYSLEGNPNTQNSSAYAGRIFEHICCIAIKNFLDGDAIIYGAPNPMNVKQIADLINEAFVREPPAYRKDRGLDILAWRHFHDLRKSNFLLLVQCAAGKNWKSKLLELNLDSWKKYIQFSAAPSKGFAAPIVLSRDEDLDEASTDAGIFFDRPRLYRYIDADDLQQELFDKIIEWCTTRIDELIGQ